MELEEALKLIETQKVEIEQNKTETAAMQSKMDELLTETKKAKQTAKDETEAAAKAAADKAKAEGDFEQLYNASQEEAAKYKKENDDLRAGISTGKLKAEAARIAAGLTKDTARAELLTEKLEKRLKLTDDGIKVLDDSGQLTVSSIDDLTSDIKKKYEFLVDGSQASGGGANGGGGGAETENPFKKGEYFNLTKQAEIFKSDPVKAAALKASAN